MVRNYRIPSIVVLLLLLVQLLAACGGGAADTPPPGPTAAAGEATTAPAAGEATTAPAAGEALPIAEGVTVTMPFFRDGIASFDHAYWSGQLLLSQGTIFEGLFGYDPQLNIVPKVAESATANADSTVWTFKLRQDKKWSNGDPVTAKDYYASWIRFMGPELKDAPMWASFAQHVKNGWAFKSGAEKAENVGIKLIDDYTLEITLDKSFPAFTSFMVLSSSMPINEKSLQEHPNDWWDPKNALFNGPYVVKSWVSGGDITLERNPNYVGDGIGNVPTVVLKPYPDANARLQAFENGEIQFSVLEDTSQVQYAQNNPTMKDAIHEELNLQWDGIQFSRAAEDGPFADIRVRKAFAMAIDKQAITDQVLKGLAVPTTAFSGDPKITEKVKPLPYDVAQAKQLMADAGFPDGQGFPEVTFYAQPANSPDMPMVEAVAKMWQDNLGVKVTIQNNEQAVEGAIRWGNINPNVKAGYTVMSGPINWFEPIALLEASDHIWYFMDFKSDWKPKAADYDKQIADVANVTAVGDWAALDERAKAAWAKRQEIISKEKDNAWGKAMQVTPTFMDQFTTIAKDFTGAADDAAKLSAYQNGLNLVLREERDTQQYDNLTESNLQAQRLMNELRNHTIESSIDTVAQLQQLAVDSGWMAPVAVRKIIYVTDPRLSGIVNNKLSWGGQFQFQYLQWQE